MQFPNSEPVCRSGSDNLGCSIGPVCDVRPIGSNSVESQSIPGMAIDCVDDCQRYLFGIAGPSSSCICSTHRFPVLGIRWIILYWPGRFHIPYLDSVRSHFCLCRIEKVHGPARMDLYRLPIFYSRALLHFFPGDASTHRACGWQRKQAPELGGLPPLHPQLYNAHFRPHPAL